MGVKHNQHSAVNYDSVRLNAMRMVWGRGVNVQDAEDGLAVYLGCCSGGTVCC